MATTRTLQAYGETLTITWTGGTWATSNGSQHSFARDALRAELVALVRAGGDDSNDTDVAAEIEQLLDGMAE